jgi:hypothetical protein
MRGQVVFATPFSAPARKRGPQSQSVGKISPPSTLSSRRRRVPESHQAQQKKRKRAIPSQDCSRELSSGTTGLKPCLFTTSKEGDI